MASVTGILGALGLSSTFTPAANQIFSVSIGSMPVEPTGAGIEAQTISPVILVRSEDGVAFLPAQATLSSLGNASIPITTSVSIDVVEQRPNIAYGLMATEPPLTPIPYGFYQ